MIARWLALGGLSALAAFAAAGVAVRSRPAGRAEAAIVAAVAWNVLVIVPAYALGLAGRLAPASLAVASAGLSVATWIASSGEATARAHARETVRTIAGIAALPLDAVRLCVRRRSPSTIAVVVAAALILFAASVAWIAPPRPGGEVAADTETVVGFTLQQHGLAPDGLPEALRTASGAPRAGALLCLWFAAWTGRALVQAPAFFSVALLAVAVYALAAGLGAERAQAVGAAAAVVIAPCVLRDLPSTRTDLHAAALVVACASIAARPAVRPRDAAIAGTALAVLLATNRLGAVWAPALGAVVVSRLLVARRGRTVAGAAAIAAGIGACAAAIWANYLRAGVALKRIGPSIALRDGPTVRWHGIDTAGEAAGGVGRFVDELLAFPRAGAPAADWGVGFGWVVAPLAAVAIVVALRDAVAAGAARLSGAREPARPAARWAPALAVAVPVAAGAALVPSLRAAHQALPAVVAAVAIALWLCARLRARALGYTVVLAQLVAAAMAVWWAPEPTVGLGPGQAIDLVRASSSERAAAVAALPWAPGLAAERARELGAGAALALSEELPVAGALWNDAFTSRVVRLPAGAGFPAAAARAGAVWIAVSPREAHWNEVVAPSSGWQEVGVLWRPLDLRAFRRAPAFTPRAARP